MRIERIFTLLESSGLSDKWTTEPGCVFIVLEKVEKRRKNTCSWSSDFYPHLQSEWAHKDDVFSGIYVHDSRCPFLSCSRFERAFCKFSFLSESEKCEALFVFEQRHVKDFIAPYKHLFMLEAMLPGKMEIPPETDVFCESEMKMGKGWMRGQCLFYQVPSLMPVNITLMLFKISKADSI